MSFNVIAARALIQTVVSCGVEHFCLAPGSRSTPLVLAAAETSGAKLHVHYDERGAAFFALGLAKVTRAPVCVIVTSGSAVGHLLPALMEAEKQGLSLIVLSADRPHHLVDTGANQTTEQMGLLRSSVAWQHDLAAPHDLTAEKVWASAALQAYLEGVESGRPVQLNCRFSPPLWAEVERGEVRTPRLFRAPIVRENSPIAPDMLSLFSKRGVIFVGYGVSKAELDPIARLAEKTGMPIIADIASGMRCYSGVLPHHTQWIESLKVDVLIHFGGAPTSKATLDWMQHVSCPHVHISTAKTRIDPLLTVTHRLVLSLESLVLQVTKNPTHLFSIPIVEEPDHWESKLYSYLSNSLPENCALFLGNSTLIRYADSWLYPKMPVDIYTQRGVSGIDGNIATACGIAAASGKFTIAIIGDQAALHDLNSLDLLAKSTAPIMLIVINNGGGKIFSSLSSVANSPLLKPYFENTHTLSFAKVAEMYGIEYSNTLTFNNKSCLIELTSTSPLLEKSLTLTATEAT